MIIKKKKIKSPKGMITLLAIIILITAALYTGPVTRRYRIESDKIENDITIGVVADLHSQYFGDNQEKIIDRLKDEQPDIILLPGDMTNSPYDVSGMVNFMEQAVLIAPTYYVLGNHEYWSYEADKICEIITETGVQVMHSDKVTLELNGNIIELHGIDDYDANYYDANYADYSWEQRLNDLWTENTASNFRILLTHRPEKVEHYVQYEYDLITAGHAHGGLVRIPFILNGLYAPNQEWFPKYAGGKYELSWCTTMIVSRGLYNYRYMPRVFNPGEVVVIEVTAEISNIE